MPSVSIIGPIGSGKTTALGLLHEALTAYTGKNKMFLFESNLTGYLCDNILMLLRAGKWPLATELGTREEVKLRLRFKKLFGWNEIEIDFYDISGNDLNNVVDSLSDKTKSPQEAIADLEQNKTLTAVLNSDVFILIIDSLICDPTPTKASELKKAEVDIFLGRMCLALGTYKRETEKAIKALALVFTKYDVTELFLPLGIVDYDSVKDIEALAEADIEARQNRSFEDVMRTYLPTTYNCLNFTLKNIKPGNLKYFRSGIMMKQDSETGKASIGLPLTFSINESVRLAKWLSSI